MPHAPKTSVNGAKMQTKRSAWTPLNHAPSNSQLFEERRVLLAKWFSRWTDAQKKTVLEDLVSCCSLDQLLRLSLTMSSRLPLQAADFTCRLPRALCLYIFSFLDPRSLCRCAQVSWRWKAIVDLDQLWRGKCARRGWYLDFIPSQFEASVWKRHYIRTVETLRSVAAQIYWHQHHHQQQQQQAMSSAVPKADSPHEELCLEDALLDEPQKQQRESRNGSVKRQKQVNRSSLSLPPWRDADRKPRDIVRFNYLDNPHSVDEAWTVKTQKSASTAAATAAASAAAVTPGNKTLTDAHYKLRKAKSLMFLSSNSRPPQSPPPCCALYQSESRIPSSVETVTRLLKQSQFNAGVRPAPVRSAVPRLSRDGLRTAQRSNRSVPSVPLLQFIQPWTVNPSNTAQ